MSNAPCSAFFTKNFYDFFLKILKVGWSKNLTLNLDKVKVKIKIKYN